MPGLPPPPSPLGSPTATASDSQPMTANEILLKKQLKDLTDKMSLIIAGASFREEKEATKPAGGKTQPLIGSFDIAGICWSGADQPDPTHSSTDLKEPPSTYASWYPDYRDVKIAAAKTEGLATKFSLAKENMSLDAFGEELTKKMKEFGSQHLFHFAASYEQTELMLNCLTQYSAFDTTKVLATIAAARKGADYEVKFTTGKTLTSKPYDSYDTKNLDQSHEYIGTPSILQHKPRSDLTSRNPRAARLPG